MAKKRSVKSSAIVVTAPKPQPEQVEQVLTWLLLGDREQEILGSIRDDFPEFAVVDSDAVFGWCFEATKLIYQMAVKDGDYAVALRAVRQLAEMA